MFAPQPPFAISTNPERRGACPTLHEPMQTGDGLLARIRVSGGLLSPTQISKLSQLAATHGNGVVEISARGNLQVRGLTRTSAQPFASAVEALLNLESGLVIDLSPIAGEDPEERTDPRPLARKIAAASQEFAGRLGPKVSVVVDSFGQVPLTAHKADIRLTAHSADEWDVGLGGSKPQRMDATGAISATIATLSAIAAMGPTARATDLFPTRSHDLAVAPTRRALVAGRPLELKERRAIPIALPFGAASSDRLAELADLAQANGVESLRLAPGHMLILVGASSALVAKARQLGFVTDGDDPRLRVSACVGSSGCASGHIAAREIGERLALRLPVGQHLHVSGCAKGCAHPRRAEVTLVGRPDGIGLVFDGRAGDTPEQIVDEGALVKSLALNEIDDDAI